MKEQVKYFRCLHPLADMQVGKVYKGEFHFSDKDSQLDVYLLPYDYWASSPVPCDHFEEATEQDYLNQ